MTLRGWMVRRWRERPGRALATAAAVAVAVAAVVATVTAAAASRAGYRAMVARIDGLPAIEIVAAGGGRFDYGLLPPLVDTAGVRAVVPQFFRPTVIRHGEFRVREGVLGVDVESLVDLGLLTLVSGEPCAGSREVVLDASFAAGLGVGVGDEVVLLFRRGLRRMTVTGLADPASLAPYSQGGSAVMEIAKLADLSVAGGHVDRVRVILSADADRRKVLAAVQQRLPPGIEARLPAGRASMADDMLQAAELGLDFVTWLTVAMAWFIVANAMLMNVSERRRALSLTRVLGATAGQVRRMVAGEALALGSVGAVVGAVLGVLAAAPVARGIAAALQMSIDRVAVDPRVVVLSLALGPLVSLAASWWPARQAGRADPLESLAHAPPAPEPGVSWSVVITALLLWALSAGILGGVVQQLLPPRAAVPAGIIMLVAYVATLPVFLPALVRLAARLVPPAWRTEAMLARDQLLRHPLRTSLTAGVLVVALTNGIGLGHAIRDNVDDLIGWHLRAVRADWVLARAGAGGRAGDMEDAIDRVAALDGVARVEAVGIVAGQVAKGPAVVVGRDMPADLPLPLAAVGIAEGQLRAALDRGEAAIGTALARRAGIRPGDTVMVEVLGRSVPVTVAGLVVDYTSGGLSVVVRRDVARTRFGIENSDFALVTAAPGRAASLAGPLAAVARDTAVVVRSFGEARAMVDRALGGVVGALWGILGLGFAVGSLGIANTVSMNVTEQTRTLGLLRAVGMARRQVVGLVLVESLVLGVAGCVAGVVGGMVTAAFIQFSSQPLLGHPVAATVRPGVIAANLGAALLVTVVAAVLPARRAARIDLLEALTVD